MLYLLVNYTIYYTKFYKMFINAFIIIKTLAQTHGVGKSHLHKDVNFRHVF